MSGFPAGFSRGVSGLRVALVGAGAVGSTLALRLAQQDAAHVLLIDPQRLEDRNHATSPFLREAFDRCGAAGVGGSTPFKVNLIAQEARRLGLRAWSAIPSEIADVGWGTLAACDVFCCCTDSVLSRVETARTARMLDKPMMEAGVSGMGEAACRYAWFPSSHEAACYLCGLSEQRRAEVLAYAASPSLGCLPLPASPAMTGTPDAVAHAAGGLLELLQRFAEGRLPPARTEAWRCTANTATSRWIGEQVTPVRSLTCPWHEASATEAVALPWEVPLEESLCAQDAAHQVLQLAWPLCIQASCRACGGRFKPFQRLAFIRRNGLCPLCGAGGSLEPLHAVDALLPGDRLRLSTPRQLGQPPEHLYLLREAVFFSQNVHHARTGEPAAR